MFLQQYLLNPTDDDRLRKPAIIPEVWHYILVMEWVTQNVFSGFGVPDDWMVGYDGDRTPRAFAMEAHSRFTMTVIDNQNSFQQWFNNYGDSPGDPQLMAVISRGAQVRVGKDKDCFVVQAWLNGYCVHAVRCDPKAPPPPGWRG